MTWPTAAALLILLLTALPAWMTFRNLGRFPRLRPAPETPAGGGLSVLIPARDEEDGIAGCVEAALAAAGDEPGFELEVVVLDDHSSDGTVAAVERLAAADPRVRLERAPALPDGWNGKQHACWVLAQRASFERLTWIDADVRLTPGSLPRLVADIDRNPAKLVSGFPEQLTTSAGEEPRRPADRRRARGLPADEADAAVDDPRLRRRLRAVVRGRPGGVLPERRSRGDPLEHPRRRRAPRAFRRAGHLTDVFDGTGSATCRMYDDFRGTWAGFAKNATEAMASPVAIFPWTVLLLGGWVMPWVMLVLWAVGVWSAPWWVVLPVAVLAFLVNLAITRRFAQGLRAGLLRPAGIATLVAIQWYALARKLAGKKAVWRGRSY